MFQPLKCTPARVLARTGSCKPKLWGFSFVFDATSCTKQTCPTQRIHGGMVPFYFFLFVCGTLAEFWGRLGLLLWCAGAVAGAILNQVGSSTRLAAVSLSTTKCRVFPIFLSCGSCPQSPINRTLTIPSGIFSFAFCYASFRRLESRSRPVGGCSKVLAASGGPFWVAWRPLWVPWGLLGSLLDLLGASFFLSQKCTPTRVLARTSSCKAAFLNLLLA